MLHVNFNAYSSYVTDSLYQWDINQKLTITGLDLTTAPEVHFANANMERAVVRQSTIDRGTITVDIPNSLLQAPLLITAYIGIYEGETFKIIESVKIPVIPKPQPTDYSFVDNVGEIYSFNEILNKMISFENKYGAVDLSAIAKYEQWVTDLRNLKSRVTPIELGGTGQTTLEGLFNMLGISGAVANIETGTYVGTGTYGSANPNTLTFNRTPKIVFVNNRVFIFGCSSDLSMWEKSAVVTWGEKSVSWYHVDGYFNQSNVEGTTYTYHAIS